MREDRSDKVSGFRLRRREDELARLKRLTGLDFEQVPESLLDPQVQARHAGEPDAPVPVRPARSS